MDTQNLSTIPDQIQERWLPIPGFPGYEVSDLGRVRSFKKKIRDQWVVVDVPQKILKPSVNDRYPKITLSCEGTPHCFNTYILVLTVFVGPCPVGHECRHLNGKKIDCSLKNLLWGTKLENANDKRKHKTMASLPGMQNGSSKLSDMDVLQIRNLYQSGISQSEITKMYGVVITTIHNIVHYKRWKHLP